MYFFEILFIGLGVSADAFAVSLSSGANKSMHTPDSTFRLSFHFGLFQFMMPIIGWLIGIKIEALIYSIDHWVAFSLLGFIGVKMIYESFHGNGKLIGNPSKGWNLVSLSLATSIDALAIGVSLAFLRVGILYPSVIFGIITAVSSYVGIKLGARLGKKFGKKTELVGGFILIIVGIKILLTDLLNGSPM